MAGGAGRRPPPRGAPPRAGHPASPGGPGGRELRTAGLATGSGRLAYDLARAGLRRTTSLYARIAPLAGAAWAEPPPPTPLAADATPSATQGTFAGAVLQTVAAVTETPELSILRTASIVDPDDPNLPRSFDNLVDAAQGWANQLIAQLPAGLPGRSAIVSRLNTLVADLDDLKDGTTADESTRDGCSTSCSARSPPAAGAAATPSGRSRRPSAAPSGSSTSRRRS